MASSGTPRYTPRLGGKRHCAPARPTATLAVSALDARGFKTAMSAITPRTPGPVTPRLRGSWAGRGLLDSVRGLAFVGVALAEAGLILALILELSDAALIFPLLFIPPTLLAVRRLANVTRRLSGEWCAVAISKPYRVYPEPDPGA